MGPLTGQWKRTPIWLQILGKPPLRRHLIWAHSEEWEYRDAAQVESIEKEMRSPMTTTAHPAPATVEMLREAIGDAMEMLNQYRGAAVQTVIDKLDAALSAPPATGGEAITARYTNWRGETAERTLIPHRVLFGSNKWHPEPQVLIEATDCENGKLRTFAAAGFVTPSSETGASVKEDTK